MGLISGLLTLPLAPVRGTVWLADRIKEQAELELYDESAIRAALIELEEARATGELSDEDIDDAENALLERLMEIRGIAGQEGNGTVE
ncbi:MAG TPA: gas vesicle protein GvpG [Thermoleophilaceae bacterium]